MWNLCGVVKKMWSMFSYYFMNKTKEEAIAMRKKNLLEYIQEKNKEINAAILGLEELDKY